VSLLRVYFTFFKETLTWYTTRTILQQAFLKHKLHKPCEFRLEVEIEDVWKLVSMPEDCSELAYVMSYLLEVVSSEGRESSGLSFNTSCKFEKKNVKKILKSQTKI